MSSSFDKFAILDSFLDEVGSYLPEIEANLDRLEQVPDDTEALEEAYRRTHTISGSASMMDFPGLSRVAHAMEDVLGDTFDEVVPLDRSTTSLLRRSLERVRLLLEAIKTGSDDEERLVAEDTADYERFRQTREVSSSSSGPVIQDAIIVPPVAENARVSPLAVSGVEADEWPTLAASGAPTGGGQERPPEAEATASGLPDWLALLATPERAAPLPEPERPLVGGEPPSPRFEWLAASADTLAPGPITRPLPSLAAEPTAPPQSPPEAFPSLNLGGNDWLASGNVFGDQAGAGSGSWDEATELALGAGDEAPQPTMEEMLAAFRSPKDGEWPEQPLLGQFPATASAEAHLSQTDPALSVTFAQPAAPAPAFPVAPAEPMARPAPLSDQPLPVLPAMPAMPAEAPASASAFSAFSLPPASRPLPAVPLGAAAALPSTGTPPAPALLAWQGVVEHEMEVRRSAATLKETLMALRAVAASIEDQRGELRGFLDGSKDAIDRLEIWAGRAMGLDLRQSPDHVRRYLPLSVLWVVTTQLKKTLARLKDAANTLAATEGEMSTSTESLAQSIRDCGTLVSSVISLATPTQGGGFSATLAHVSWSPRVEKPPELTREELREQMRGEVRQELRAEIAEQVRREERDRLRKELEIELRQQVLDQLTAASETAVSRPVTSPLSLLRQGIGVPLPPPEPKAKKVARGVEQSEEALEVFRAEAEEHLQNIGSGVTALERAPEDREALQSIRRFTHTLKGAAAMMGFTQVADLSHIFEDLLDQIMEGTVEVHKEVLSVILDTAEALELLVFGKTGERGGDAAVVETLRRRYQVLLGHLSADLPSGQAGPIAAAVSLAEEEAEELTSGRVEVEHQAGHALSVSTGGGAMSKSELSVRIKLKKLDELVNLFGEVLVNRSVLDERLNRLLRMVADVGLSSLRLRDVGGQLETRYETAMMSSGRSPAPARALEGVGSVAITTGPLDRSKASFGRQLMLPPSPQGGAGEAPPSPTADFDELELDRYNEFHRLTRGLSEGISDMSTLSSEMETTIRECEQIFQRENRLSSAFQDQLLKVRLVPLSMLVPRLHRAAQAVALRLGKEVDLVVEGEETEVDRTVYEEVAAPLLHLVRNAVTHGIESPQVREAAGKPRAGQIKLSARYEANQVIITVREDGAGIDAERVRHTAIARSLLDARAPLSEQSVLNLIFRPGFSTAEVVSEESGRGVGLDVVHDVVTRLRGTIEVESTPGDGTAWTMKFPITLQIQRAVLVKVAEQTFAIPMALVEQITRLDYHSATRALGVPAIEVRGESYVLMALSSLLALPTAKFDERASVLLVAVGRQRYALVVEGVVGKQEIVVKNMGPHLRQVRGVAGATVLGNGQVILILEILDLLAQQRLQSAAPSSVLPAGAPGPVGGTTAPTAPPRVAPPTWTSSLSTTDRGQAPPAAPPERPQGQYVLVVDDSPSVRRVVSNMLKMAGWEVQTARDGVEAMEVAAKHTPAAVLLDIEMPRMDGYELMATLRSQEQYRHLPLIVLTSRAAAKHHQRAFQLGADAYLVKPYQDEELLKTLNTLVKGARA